MTPRPKARGLLSRGLGMAASPFALPTLYPTGHRPWGHILREEAALPERLLALLWRNKTGRSLRTTDGRKLKVVYPGRPAPGHGPDFRDALLDLDGQRLHGEVELHRRPQDWRAHGHHQDPAYDSVVMHVVGQASPEGRRGAPSLPTLVLTQKVYSEEATSAPLPSLGRLSNLSGEALAAALRRAGMAWYELRVLKAREAVEAKGVEQALYAGMLESLGYSENRSPFLALSQTLPASLVRAAVRLYSPPERASTIRRLLMTAAGWEVQGPVWANLIAVEPMPRDAWRTSGVRPLNHPRRRIEAAAVLLDRHLTAGLASTLAAACQEGPDTLLQALTVTAKGEGGTAALLGPGRATAMAVNAILPVMAAWTRTVGNSELDQQCRECYSRLPALPSNTITREALRLINNPEIRGVPPNACMTQGLMHLYRSALA